MSPLARRPALSAAVLLIAGIMARRALPPRPVLWIAVLAILALASLLARRPVRSSLALAASIFMLGATVAQLDDCYYPAHHVSRYAGDEPRLAQLELEIVQPPRVLSNPFVQFHAPPPRQVTMAKVTGVKTRDGWADAAGLVLVQIDQPHPRLALGQQLVAVGRLQRPGPAMNPGQFDWENYYREQRVLASLTVPRAENLQIFSEGRVSRLGRLRERVRAALGAGFTADRSLDHALLRALLLGDNDPELRDVQEQFRRTGTSHQLCVSGMHVAVLGGFVYLLCRLLCLRPRASAWLVMGFVVLYGLVALPAPPVVRSVVLCLAYGCGALLGRPRDAIQMLGLSVCGMLLYHPMDLYTAGFQLSFGTVLGLMLFCRPVLELVESRWNVDERIALSFRDPPPAQRLWYWLRRKTVESLAVGAVAWFVSAPLIVLHFDQINPWAVPAGLLLFPLVFLGLVAGLMKVALTSLLPGFAHAWASLAALPVAWVRQAVDLLARVPGADVPLPPPPVWLIVLYYALLCLPLLPAFLKPRVPAPPGPALPGGNAAPALPGRRRLVLCLRCGPAGAALMVFLLPVLLGVAPRLGGAGAVRVTLLAVGAGQVGVVELASGQVVLIDDGSSTLADPFRKALAPYLRQRGRWEVGTMFLSHPDFDHIAAAADTAAVYAVRDVYVSPVFRAHSSGNAPAELLLSRLDRAGLPPRTIHAGESVALDAETTLRVLWPPPGRAFATTNNAGLVLRLTCRGRSVLFPADVQVATERELIAQASKDPTFLRADVLVAPHHGSAESTTADFVRAVDPQVILSSNDRRLTHKQLDFEQSIGARPLYRTNRCGAITVTIGKGGELGVETYLKTGPTVNK